MNVYEYLLSYNIKPSVQRIAIIYYLLKHHTHPCIDEIYLALCKDIPTLSKTTVYNTLKILVEQGAVQMLTIDDKNSRYDADITPHAHFRCSKCGCIKDLPIKENIIFKEDSEKIKITEVQLYCKGYCTQCLKDIETKNT